VGRPIQVLILPLSIALSLMKGLIVEELLEAIVPTVEASFMVNQD